MYLEVRRIRALIKSCYNGPAWHGPAVLETLELIMIDFFLQLF